MRREPANSAPQGAEAAAHEGSDGEDADELALKQADQERELGVARRKLEKAKMELSHQELECRDKLVKAEAELEIARKDMMQFENVERPLKLQKARIGLDRSRDRYQESKEELEQLKMMYETTDLADKTREIVLRRGERRLKLDEQELAADEVELKALESHALPQEQKKLSLELDGKERALASVKRETEAQTLDKKISLQGEENSVTKLEQELAATKAKIAKNGKKS